MKNISGKFLKKHTSTLVKYGHKNGLSDPDTVTVGAGTDPTNTTITVVTTSSYLFRGFRK